MSDFGECIINVVLKCFHDCIFLWYTSKVPIPIASEYQVSLLMAALLASKRLDLLVAEAEFRFNRNPHTRMTGKASYAAPQCLS